jgi:hypothetical protein
MIMIEELALIVLKVDLLQYRLKAGDMGTVVDAVKGGEAYVVEFMTILGRTIAVVEVSPAQIRRIEQGEIASARQIEAIP